MSSMTIIRLLELQAWPTFSIRVTQAVLAASWTLSVSRMMYGSEPPSSRTTFFRLRPAVSATNVPARPEPVRDTARRPRAAAIPGRRGAARRRAVQPGSRDHRGALLVGGEGVDVHAARHACVLHDLRDRQGRG